MACRIHGRAAADSCRIRNQTVCNIYLSSGESHVKPRKNYRFYYGEVL